MHVRLKAFLGLVIIVALGFIFFKAYLQFKPPETLTPTIKIGVNLPLTGDFSETGAALKKTLDVFQTDMQTKPLKNKYEFVVTDMELNAPQTNKFASKFIKSNKLNAIIDFGEISGKMLSEVATEKKIIHINIGSNDVTTADGVYNFSHTTLTDDEIALLTKDIKNKYQNISIIHSNIPQETHIATNLLENIIKQGLTVNTTSVNSFEENLENMIEKSALYLPDVYVLVLAQPTLENFLKTIQDKGIITPVTGLHTLENVKDLNLLNNVVFVGNGTTSPELSTQVTSNNTNDIISRTAVGNLYDSLSMLIKAFETAPEEGDVATYLSSLKEWNGVMGRVLNKGNGIFAVPPAKFIVKEGMIYKFEENNKGN